MLYVNFISIKLEEKIKFNLKKEFCSHTFGFTCLLDIQVEMSGGQLVVQVWRLGQRTKLAIHVKKPSEFK